MIYRCDCQINTIAPDVVMCRDRMEPEDPLSTAIFLLDMRRSHIASPPNNRNVSMKRVM